MRRRLSSTDCYRVRFFDGVGTRYDASGLPTITPAALVGVGLAIDALVRLPRSSRNRR